MNHSQTLCSWITKIHLYSFSLICPGSFKHIDLPVIIVINSESALSTENMPVALGSDRCANVVKELVLAFRITLKALKMCGWNVAQPHCIEETFTLPLELFFQHTWAFDV